MFTLFNNDSGTSALFAKRFNFQSTSKSKYILTYSSQVLISKQSNYGSFHCISHGGLYCLQFNFNQCYCNGGYG